MLGKRVHTRTRVLKRFFLAKPIAVRSCMDAFQTGRVAETAISHSIGRQLRARCVVAAALAACNFFVSAAEVSQWEVDLSRGIGYRKQGNLELSIEMLAQSARAASTD